MVILYQRVKCDTNQNNKKVELFFLIVVTQSEKKRKIYKDCLRFLKNGILCSAIEGVKDRRGQNSITHKATISAATTAAAAVVVVVQYSSFQFSSESMVMLKKI